MAGRMDRNRIREVRITNADVVNGVERQTGGQIKASDFYPIPVEVPLAGYIELVRGKKEHTIGSPPTPSAAGQPSSTLGRRAVASPSTRLRGT